MVIEFRTSAADLHRACLRVTQSDSMAGDENSALFTATSQKLGILVKGVSETLAAGVQIAGTASVPLTILAGVVHVLPYFGEKTVEIGFSRGKMRIDTTVFHNRGILLPVRAAVCPGVPRSETERCSRPDILPSAPGQIRVLL